MPAPIDPRPLPGPQPAPQPNPTAAPSTEVVLHELGESIAAAVGKIQQELARYTNALGSYVMDEMEVSIPIRMRVDDLGQTLVAVDQAGQNGSSLRLRLKPVPPVIQAQPASTTQPLESLGLTADQVAKLKEHRVFSVDDLQRVARNVAGQEALAKVTPGQLAAALDKAQLLSLPMLPPAIATALVRSGIATPADFVKQEPVALAKKLSDELKVAITADDVKKWQSQVDQSITAAILVPRLVNGPAIDITVDRKLRPAGPLA
jgi:hypothetical protein